MSPASMDRIGSARLASLALAAAASMFVVGCSAPRTWPSAGGASVISADTPPLPQVVIASVKYAHEQIAKDSPLVYNLPSDMNVPAFATYERGLAPGKPMCPGDTNVWTVRQARIDGSKAQVDIEYPSRDGFYQTVTVHLQGATGGFDYRPAYLQYWKVPVKDPVCQQPLAVVERTCGADAAAALRKQREAMAPAGDAAAKPAAAAPMAGGEEPTK